MQGDQDGSSQPDLVGGPETDARLQLAELEANDAGSELETPSPSALIDHQARAFPIVGIGASAGGLAAITELLAHLPARTGMAYVVVQHLDPKHESVLPELLARATPLPVARAEDGLAVEPDHLYVIPPDRNLSVVDGVLRLAQRSKDRARFLPIDHFLASLALDRKALAIGVILSGTAADGVRGLEDIATQGGITFAQDEASAKYAGMPHAAAVAGCVDFVLPPAEIARELARIATHPYVRSQTARPPREEGAPGDEDAMATIIARLRWMGGVDFTHYKRTSLKRRVERRMALLRFERMERYVAYLEDHASEVTALFGDVLINVSSFFRDPETFAALQARVLTPLVSRREHGGPIRVWVPGCASGEEAFSLAICLLEAIEEAGSSATCQIFATDASQTAIARARAGVYSSAIAADVTPERLQRFFVELDAGYQVVQAVREVVVFARHDVTADPPFSRMDLVSCRNVLIYMDAILQRRVIPTLHYALNPRGFLLLGASEGLGGSGHLFEAVDKKHRIFVRKQVRAAEQVERPPRAAAARWPDLASRRRTPAAREDTPLGAAVDRLLLERYLPAAVVVNDDLEILQFRGRTSPYLEHAPGRSSLSLLKMAREGLGLELRTLIAEARAQGGAAEAGPFTLLTDGDPRAVIFEAVPIHGSGADAFLVVFRDVRVSVDDEAPAARPDAGAQARLERDLAATREQLREILEEQDTTVAELKATNEELLSANEELQSTNEELETAREELQSTNEELTTLNDELRIRMTELSRANDDIANLIDCVDIAIVMIDRELRIRRFTPAAERVLRVIPGDVGRPLTDLQPHIDVPDLEALLRGAVERAASIERDVQDREGRWYSMQVKPYRSKGERIDGAVLVLQDIDVLKAGPGGVLDSQRAAAAAIRDLGISEERFRRLVDSSVMGFVVIDREGRVLEANDAFLAMTGYERSDLPLAEETLTPAEWGAADRRAAEQVEATGVASAYEKEFWRKDQRRVPVLLGGIALGSGSGERATFVVDITERRQIEDSKRRQEREHQDLERSAFLSRAAALLESSLDYEETFRRIARHAVPRLGDWCICYVPLESGQLRCVAVAHADPGRADLAAAIMRHADCLAGSGPSPSHVMESGRSVLVADVSTIPPAATGCPECARLLRELKARSTMIVSIRARRRQLGALQLFASESGDGYGPSDVGLAEALADRVGIAIDNARLYREAQEAVRAREEFLSIASHELKTPLTALQLKVQGALRAARRAEPAPLDAERLRVTLESVEREAARLGVQIDALLDLSRMQAGKLDLELETVDLAEVAQEVVEQVGEASRQSGSTVAIRGGDAPVTGRWDRARLEQVVSNLVVNAVKFGRGGPIEVALDADEAWVHLAVRDRGVGIAASDLPRVFSPFGRVGALSQGGLGLGLYIVRQIVEALGGRVRVESELGVGSTFSVALPRDGKRLGETRPGMC